MAVSRSIIVSVLIACTSTVREEAAPEDGDAPPAEAAIEPTPQPITPPAIEPVVADDEPQPPPEPVAEETLPPPKIRASTRFPKNLYIAEGHGETGWTVDIIDMWTGQEERVTAALHLDDTMDVDDVTLEPGGPALPPSWGLGDTWTIVTRQGVLRRDVARYALQQGAGEMHLRVELANAKTSARKPALAIRGRKVADDLVFDKPKPRDATALGDDGIERVRKAVIDAADDPEIRKVFAKAKIAARHLEVYDARLPAPWKSVVFLDAPSRAWGEPARASALVLLAEDGRLGHVSLPDVEAGVVRARAILDVDGNGIDEVFYEDFYYEGAYETVLVFDGDKPKHRVLTGDGA